jgi:hypothetical protein
MPWAWHQKCLYPECFFKLNLPRRLGDRGGPFAFFVAVKNAVDSSGLVGVVVRPVGEFFRFEVTGKRIDPHHVIHANDRRCLHGPS